MSDFVHFYVEGRIYGTDKNGNKNKTLIKHIRFGRGVTRKGPDMMGKIFRQVPHLTPCDAVIIETEDI